MRLALGHAFSLSDMFIRFPVKKTKITSKDAENICGLGTRKVDVAKAIFIDCLKMVLRDIIYNNVTFELPTGGKHADMRVIRIEGEDFKKARQRGAFKDIDYLATNFSSYQVALTIHTNHGDRTWPVYVAKDLKKVLTDNVNNGKQYG